MVFCTIAAHNYISKAIVLARSVRAQYPHATIVLCVPERHVHPRVQNDACFDVVLSHNAVTSDADERNVFVRDVLEWSTAIKPALCRYLFGLYPNDDHIVFLDPDVVVVSRLDELEELWTKSDILVTPHHVFDPDGSLTTAVFRTGVFNLGFLGLRRGPVASKFLEWWDNKLKRFCFVDFTRLMFVDQRWLDLAVCLFPIGIVRHAGYNVAYWNVGERPLALEGDMITAGGMPLRFFHFARFESQWDIAHYRRLGNEKTEIVLRARDAYARELQHARRLSDGESFWSYDVYESGQWIEPAVRKLCREHPALLSECARPFAMSNEFFVTQAIQLGLPSPEGLPIS